MNMKTGESEYLQTAPQKYSGWLSVLNMRDRLKLQDFFFSVSWICKPLSASRIMSMLPSKVLLRRCKSTGPSFHLWCLLQLSLWLCIMETYSAWFSPAFLSPLYALNKFSDLLRLLISYFLIKCLNSMYLSTLKICCVSLDKLLLLSLFGPVQTTGYDSSARCGKTSSFWWQPVSWAMCELVPDQSLMTLFYDITQNLGSSGISLKVRDALVNATYAQQIKIWQFEGQNSSSSKPMVGI